MKLLALTPSFYGRTGDAVNERQLIIALSKKVEKCYIITFIGFKQVFTKRRIELRELKYLPKNVKVIIFPFPYVHPLFRFLGMITISCLTSILGLILCWLRKSDLVYIQDLFLSIGLLTFQSLARGTVVKIPAIFEDELSNGGITGFCMVYAAPMDRLVLAKAARVAVPGRTFYDEHVRRRSLIHKHPPLQIPPGVDLKLMRKIRGPRDRESPRVTWNIGFIGSLEWWQGVDILTQAIALLKEENSSLKLVIIGNGMLRSLIEKQCKALNIPYEMTGLLPYEEALRRLSILEVMVLPRRRTMTTESVIPIKVIEAWALGIPVIVTNHRVFLEYGIKDFEDIIYCEPQPTSVAKTILTLLNNSTLREKLKINGLKLAMQFDYDKIAQNLLKVVI